jgi:DNA-binding beta-propeller fold protein YncE
VALDEQGNLYVTDTGNHRLVRLAPDGSPNGEWSGFHFPHGIALAGQDAYVSDESGVHKLSVTGEREADWPGFGDPYGLAIGGDGTLYVTDTDGGRVHALSPQGDVLASWGSEGSAPGQFKIPEAVAVDPDGRLYVADRGNDRVQVFK